jgi:hypothetical protein
VYFLRDAYFHALNVNLLLIGWLAGLRPDLRRDDIRKCASNLDFY